MLPIRLELENFMSHENSVIDFTEFSSALIVGEIDGDSETSNGAGKSAILEGLTFALYNETRHKAADSAVKRGKEACRAVLVFEHEGSQYRVERTRAAKSSKMEVSFERLKEDGSTPDNLTADTNRATNNVIKDTIKMSYETFINSAYFKQSSVFEFAESTSSKRQRLIINLMDLDNWEVYQKKAAEYYKEINNEISTLESTVKYIGDVAQKLSSTRSNLEKIDRELKDKIKEEESNEASIKDIEYKLSTNKEDFEKLNQLSKLEERVDYHKKIVTSAQEKVKRKEQEVLAVNNNIDGTNTAIKETEQQIKKVADYIADTGEVPVNEMENAVVEGKSKLRHLEEQLKNLDNPECSLCGNDWGDRDIGRQKWDLENEIRALKDKLRRAAQKVQSAKDLAASLHKSEIEIEKYSTKKAKLESSLETLEIRLQVVSNEVKESKEQILTAEEAIQDTQREIDRIGEISISGLGDTKEQLSQLNGKRQQLRREIEQAYVQKGSLTEQEKHLLQDNQKLNELQGQLKEKKKEASVYGQLSKVFGKDGVPAIIIDNIVEELSQETNKWLSELCNEPTQIEFITQKKSTKGDWKETFDFTVKTSTGECAFEDLSGGEQFRVAFAIRLGLSHLQSKRMGGEAQVLLLDEVSSSLDSRGLRVFAEIVKSLEKSMKILVITHDDKLKEFFNHIVYVKKTGDCSVIKQEKI